MASLFLLSLSTLLFLSATAATAATAAVVKLPLSPLPAPDHSNPFEFIAKSTLLRAHRIKHPSKPPSSAPATPLYARSYGGYSVSIPFGTPPQTIPLVFDTGSSLLWVPCTSRYTCSNCTFSGIDATKIPTFKPKLSSSTRILGCANPKCGLLFGSDLKSRCPNCAPNPKNCSEVCPSYLLQYGLGATAGLLITETLDLPHHKIRNFLVGCSVLSLRQPEGIAGFGRAPTSLPSQLKLSKFSYCLISHKFDDTQKSSNLFLYGGSVGGGGGAGACAGVSYTPFRKNPAGSPYDEYYYVTLRKISVGGKHVKIPFKYLIPDPNGNGGTIVDSGSTLTFMEQAVYEPLVAEFTAQLSHFKRVQDVEARMGLGPCYNVTGRKEFIFPELILYFKGGAQMKLPLANYFSAAGPRGVLCMTIVTDKSPAGPGVPVGPAIILGNNQQQNFYIEYDLENQRFGFKKQKCA